MTDLPDLDRILLEATHAAGLRVHIGRTSSGLRRLSIVEEEAPRPRVRAGKPRLLKPSRPLVPAEGSNP